MSIAIKEREPNGRHKRPPLTQEERETISIGLKQPHRKGSRVPEHEWRCELFGRLILDKAWGFDEQGRALHYGPRELWDAGNKFKREYHAWQRAKASRRAWANENRPASHAVDEAKAIQRANEAIERYQKTVGIFGYLPGRIYEAAVDVILADQPEDWVPAWGVVESTYDALVALAEYYATRPQNVARGA